MKPIEIVAQVVGIFAMLFNILSYQCKQQKGVIFMQLIGGLLFAVNFLMLGAAVGGILNIIAVLRAVLFMFEDKLKADRLPWLFAFMALYILVYVMSFTVFDKKPTAYNLIIELLPVIGMSALSIGFRMKDAANIRKWGLVSSPSWLIYNIAVGSVGAIICETLTLVSIFMGMARHDKKQTASKNAE